MKLNPRWGLAGSGVLVFLLAATLLATKRKVASRRSGRREAFGPDPAPRGIPLPPLASPRVLVEKSAHRLTVYDGQRPVKCYRVAVGGGKGDKVREGDRCTPEGEFIVCVKNPQSSFTRALGLNYPNIEDARRGLRDGLITPAQHDAIVAAARAGRRPPWDTPLGGEIMIHGAGQGRDWTAGCIALDDGEIVELYEALPVGTPVRIVP